MLKKLAVAGALALALGAAAFIARFAYVVIELSALVPPGGFVGVGF